MGMSLATTPGGINAVLATAESTDTNVLQSRRLFAVCLLVPFVIRKLKGYRVRVSPIDHLRLTELRCWLRKSAPDYGCQQRWDARVR
jgi:hypothetical protein